MQKVWLLMLACSVMMLPLRAYAVTPQSASAPPCIGMSMEAMHHGAHSVMDEQMPVSSQHCDTGSQCSGGCMHCLVCPHGVAAALPMPVHVFPLAQRAGIKSADHGRLISTTLSPDLRPPILA